VSGDQLESSTGFPVRFVIGKAFGIPIIKISHRRLLPHEFTSRGSVQTESHQYSRRPHYVAHIEPQSSSNILFK
jgi:hypothetical protein